MSFWDKIQEDLKKNLQEGIEIFKEGSSVFTEKIEELTGEGKKKYQVFNLNMKVQEEFAKLGGTIYDLTVKRSKDPISNVKVKAILAKINKMEAQINKLEDRKPAKKKAAAKKKTVMTKGNARTTTKKKSGCKNN